MDRSGELSRSGRTFRAQPEALAEARAYVRGLAEEANLPERATEDLVLAASEACANAVLHSGSPTFELEWVLHEDRVEVTIRDGGRFRSRVRLANVEGPGGFGIPLMAALTEELLISEGTPRSPGTRIRLVKRLETL